ncbi:hypothetical protein JRI60_04240 [Archangium violaceum]|uniref:hypothetical protein n=1 Tax=Archangium violaceum TaxID=83451 RepID=UPI00194E6E22|nr:hypothetical protein [Archangium violaceum]QRN98287.1 hypothetical protein JRI60_04240 [Archangium violaceum]
MSELPEALRPWARQLSLFPEDLALSLGAHVARLAAAIGPMRPRTETEGGEFHGYDGLTRRGSPERLLMSEWLMALEAPDEFVRRAAFGELAYLRPAFRQPQGGRRLVVLLDTGPDQFGPPRIAHLALLVVLARRAETAGAGFAWGVLQSPASNGPFTTVDVASIGQWLKAGSAAPPSDTQLAAWREALQLGRAPDDVWLVGGARLSRLQGTERLSRVAVEEVIAPGARRLAVEVRPASRAASQVVVELPPVPQCVRLLRDPFVTSVAAPVLDTRAGIVRTMRFSADGLRLLLAYADGGVAAQAIGQSPRATTPRPKRFQPLRDESVVAMGWRHKGGLLAVTLRGRTLHVHGALKNAATGRATGYPLPEGDESFQLPRKGEPPLLALTQMHQGRNIETAYVLDAAGVLYRLMQMERGPRVIPVSRGVSALAERKGALYFVSRGPGGSQAAAMLQLERWMPANASVLELGLVGDGVAYFGHATESGFNEAGPLVVRHQPGGWCVLRYLTWLEKQPDKVLRTELSPPIGMRVVGVCSHPSAGTPALVVLGKDERTFSLVTGNGATETLVVAPSPVVNASVSHALPMLAWLTKSGEVGVWSFPYKALVFRSTSGGTP